MKLSEVIPFKLACNHGFLRIKALNKGFDLRNVNDRHKYLLFHNDMSVTSHNSDYYFLEKRYKELTLTEFMAIEEEQEKPAEKDYSKDEIIKWMLNNGWYSIDSEENSIITYVKMILKRIDGNDDKAHRSGKLLAEKIDNLMKVIVRLDEVLKLVNESEKRSREYTDQLRNDIHKQILK
jgi:hypothetical protein